MPEKSSTTPKLSLADAIRRARTSLGWTQAELAERLGVKRASVSLWETGQAPGPLNMTALRDLLGDAFIEPVEPMRADQIAYLRGRIDQIAQHMAAVLEEQRALSRELADKSSARVSADRH